MLEILILIVLCRNIAAKARAKGRSGGWFGFLLVVLWYGGALCGVIIAGVASMVITGGDEPEMVLMVVGALGGAILGAVVAFAIVGSIAPATPAGRYDDRDDDDYDDRPRRARPRDDRW